MYSWLTNKRATMKNVCRITGYGLVEKEVKEGDTRANWSTQAHRTIK